MSCIYITTVSPCVHPPPPPVYKHHFKGADLNSWAAEVMKLTLLSLLWGKSSQNMNSCYSHLLSLSRELNQDVASSVVKLAQICRPFIIFWQLKPFVSGTQESIGPIALTLCKASDSQWASCTSCNYCFLSTCGCPDQAHRDSALNLLDVVSQPSR